VQVGDALIGLASTGLHTNGYTLARKLLATRLEEHLGGTPLREALLAEHPSYLQAVAPLLDRGLVHGLAHITGGGLPGNLPRMLPDGLAARLDPGAWPRLTIFTLLAEYNLAEDEMYRTFNMGIGMVLACDAGATATILAGLPAAYHIGQVIEQRGVQRVEGI
jgi:phosphoribosylformylglycinamidine cyclo-ligase